MSSSMFPLVRLARVARRVPPIKSVSSCSIGLESVESWSGRLIEESLEPADSEGAEFEQGDILFGKLRPYLAKVWVADRPGTYIGDFIRLRPFRDCDPEFLGYVLRSREVIEAASAESLGTKMPRTEWERLRQLQVPAPPLEVQHQVVDYLDRETTEIDSFIEDKQIFRRLLIERWVSGLVNVVQPQLLEPDSGEAERARPSWIRTRLKTTVESEKNGSWGAEPGVDQVTRRCIRVADFDKHSGRIHSNNETTRSYPVDQANSLALKAGDLIIEKSGGGPTSPVGNVVLYTGSGGDLFSNFVARVRLRADIDPRFALYLHRALYLSGITNRSIKQTTGIQNLDTSSYFDETIWLPSPAEQRVLGQRVEAQRDFIDETLKDVDLSITLAEERRAALISAAVTGQFDVMTQGSSATEQSQNSLESNI